MSIEIRKGTMADVEAYIRFLWEVRDGMEHKEWFFLDPPEDIRRMMADGSMQLWLAVDQDKIAAGFDYIVPGLSEINYGYDLGFSEDQLIRVINMDNAAVHPDYRGQGLQRRLLETAEQTLKGQGVRCLLCTIHPDNCFSLENALRQGYVIRKKLPKYGSVRYFLQKDIL